MHKRKTSPFFEIKELYTIADIEAYTRNTLSRQNIKRQAEAAGIVFHKVGTSLYIPIDEFRLKMPTLWDSLVSAKVIRLDYDD